MWTAPDEWQGRVVLSVYAAADGARWLGTEGAGIYRLQDGKWSRFGAAEGLPNLFVWSQHAAPDGSLWIGTVNTCIRRIYEKLHVRSRSQAVAKMRAHVLPDTRRR